MLQKKKLINFIDSVVHYSKHTKTTLRKRRIQLLLDQNIDNTRITFTNHKGLQPTY